MKMTQTSVCTAHFVESHITSGALSKNTFIVIMVRSRKLQYQSCMYVYVTVGTECAPATSNSTSVDYDHDPNSDRQEVAIDDYLAMDESDSFEDEKWKCAKFLLHVTEEHHLTHDGVTNLSNSVQWLVDSLFSQVKERITAHLSDTVDKETILKICEPGDIFSGLNTRYLREKFYKEHFNFVVNFQCTVIRSC